MAKKRKLTSKEFIAAIYNPNSETTFKDRFSLPWYTRFNVCMPIFFLITGLFIRLEGTLGGYFAMTFDQGKDLLALHSIVIDHKFTLIGSSAGIDGTFHGVWWYWFLSPFFYIFGGDPKLLLVVFGIFCASAILVAYVLGATLKNSRLGLICAGLVTFSSFYIGTASQLWHPNAVTVFVLLFLWVFGRYLLSNGSFFWVGVFSGLIFEFQLAFGIFFIPSFILALIINRSIPKIRDIGLGIGGCLLWMLPRFLFDLRHGFLQSRALLNFLLHPILRHTSLSLVARFQDRTETFFNLFKNAFARDNPFIAWGLLLIIVIFLIFYLRRESARLKKLVFIVVTQIFLLFIITSLYPNVLWDYYLIGFPSLFLPILGLSLYRFAQVYKRVGWLLILGLLFFNFSPQIYLNPTIWEGDASVYKNQIAVVDGIYKEAGVSEFNVSVYSPSVIDYTYQYLFLWYGKAKYNYMPSRDKIKKTVFFIIEPDRWNPILKEAWLRDRNGDGTIVWQRRFAGGIEVEKRIRQ